jgi:hypothetical protein
MHCHRKSVRRRDVAPLVNELIEWMKRERAKLPGHNAVAKALSYTLKRVDVFTRFLHDGRICLSNKCGDAALRHGSGRSRRKRCRMPRPAPRSWPPTSSIRRRRRARSRRSRCRH